MSPLLLASPDLVERLALACAVLWIALVIALFVAFFSTFGEPS